MHIEISLENSSYRNENKKFNMYGVGHTVTSKYLEIDQSKTQCVEIKSFFSTN